MEGNPRGVLALPQCGLTAVVERSRGAQRHSVRRCGRASIHPRERPITYELD